MADRTIRRSSAGPAWLAVWAVLAAAPLPSPAPAAEKTSKRPLREVVVVFKTHFDIGYTDLAANVVRRYRTSMIDGALAVVDASRELPPEQRFVWTIPGWPMAKILEDWPGQTDARRGRLRKAFKEGRFVVHGLPFTLHTESLELEELVRGLGFSSRLARSAGLELPRDAKMTDVPSHSWVLPTLLKHAGVEFLHLGCNFACPTPDVPVLFWWEGPDGSRVLTMYSGGYGTGLLPPGNWPHATWLAMIMTGDNHGPPSPGSVKRLLETARKKLPGVKVRLGRLSDFSDALRKEKPQLPVLRADMPDTWIHGVMSMPIETGIARSTRPAIAALESLNTLLGIWGVRARPAGKVVAAAYAHGLRFGEHTWGIDSKGFGPRAYGTAWQEIRGKGRYKRLEESWVEKGADIWKMQKLIQPALAANATALAGAVRRAGRRIVVFNPLPWRRGGIVRVTVTGAAPAALQEVESGKRLAVQKQGKAVCFLARDVPPMGYRTYACVDPAAGAGGGLAGTADGRTIENDFFRVKLDPAGGAIASLVDKRTGRELAGASKQYRFGQYLYERHGRAEVERYLNAYLRTRPGWAVADLGKPGLPPASEAPYAAAVAGNMSLSIRRGPVSVSATMKAPPSKAVPHAVTLTVTLHRALPVVDLAWSIRDKKADPWPEAGWLCLPVNAKRPAFRLGRPGGIADPAKDFIRSSNRDAYCLNGGLAVLGADGGGMGLCAVDCPLVSLGRPGSWRYSRDYVPTSPVVFVQLYNNQVSTNFQQWIAGSWTARVRLWAVDKYDSEASLVTPAAEARVPLQAAAFDGPAGTLPTQQAGLELSRKGVAVTAFGANPDNGGLVLRLWEQAGRDGPCQVRLPKGLKVRSVQPCDLRGRAVGKAVPVENGRFEIAIGHYAPVSVLIATD